MSMASCACARDGGDSSTGAVSVRLHWQHRNYHFHLALLLPPPPLPPLPPPLLVILQGTTTIVAPPHANGSNSYHRALYSGRAPVTRRVGVYCKERRSTRLFLLRLNRALTETYGSRDKVLPAIGYNNSIRVSYENKQSVVMISMSRQMMRRTVRVLTVQYANDDSGNLCVMLCEI
ncbi:hypothetical protein M0804_003345 [Polistes exclamans]|nr:hypothetical protein M0804_003345 [Polistes exclamans]